MCKCHISLAVVTGLAAAHVSHACDTPLVTATDIIIEKIDGPYAAEVCPPEEPVCLVFEVIARGPSGGDLEYQLDVCPVETPTECVLLTEFEDSPIFNVGIAVAGRYAVTARVRYVGDFATAIHSRGLYVYDPSPTVVPIDERASFEPVGRGQFAVTWHSNPANNNLDGYEIVLTPASDTGLPALVQRVEVDKPDDEPAEYEVLYDFANAQPPELAGWLMAMNEAIALDAAMPTLAGVLQVHIDAIVDEVPHTYVPLDERLNLACEMPFAQVVKVDVDFDNRQAYIVLDEIALPGNDFYSADVARIYYNSAYGQTPGDYWEIPNPTNGDRVLIVDGNGDPIPSGAVTGTILVNIIDQQGGELEGILQRSQIGASLGVPECWDGVDNDGDGLVDFMLGGDPECTSRTDPFEYAIGNNVPLDKQALIVYNTNTADAAGIAQHYIDARNIGEEYLCPITVAPGLYGSAEELSHAANTIRTRICELAQQDNALETLGCSDISGQELAGISRITHLVLIKGIPARLYGTSWPTDGQEPSFDYYLAYAVYHDDVLLSPDGRVPHGPYDGLQMDTTDYQPRESIYSYVRGIDPALDGILAYGRVEAITTQRTKDLIDRTVAAERAGVSGNFLHQGKLFPSQTVDPLYEFLSHLSSARDDPNSGVLCDPVHYLGDAEIDWPHRECRSGVTDDGIIPGEILGNEDAGKIQSIPYAVEAGLYLGHGVPTDADPAHNGFSGFANMLNWRHYHPEDDFLACRPMCEDWRFPALVEACRDHSKDYFQEFNTDCIGAAPGWMGWQHRSFPVQYYGFTPPGWHMATNGDVEKTPPHRMSPSPFGNYYLHFGDPDAIDDPVCNAPNESFSCPELIAVRLRADITLAEPIILNEDTTFRISFRYRHGGGNTGTIGTLTSFIQDGNPNHVEEFGRVHNISAPQSEWTESFRQFTVPQTVSPIGSINVLLYSTLSQQVRGYVDLDLVELREVNRFGLLGSNLIPSEIASFEGRYTEETEPGDWAANAIDRLGAVAWWGSSSHHLTQGHAFAAPKQFIGAFYAGRTLGESLCYLGRSAVSGIIYGDPLYRPSGAKIYLNEGIIPINDPESPFTFYGDQPESYEGRRLWINAFHGQAGLETPSESETRWEVSKCFGDDADACNQADAWILVASDSGLGVIDHRLENVQALTDLLDPNVNEDQDIVLKLRVWNPDQELDSPNVETHYNDLINYAYFRYLMNQP